MVWHTSHLACAPLWRSAREDGAAETVRIPSVSSAKHSRARYWLLRRVQRHHLASGHRLAAERGPFAHQPPPPLQQEIAAGIAGSWFEILDVCGHLAPLEHHKITVQMGRDLSIAQAIQLDQLVGQRLRRAMDPLGDVESYLKSQKGGPNVVYKRPDV